MVNILVENLGASHLAYHLVSELSRIAEEVHPVVYYKTLARSPMLLRFPCIQMAEAFNQQGIVVATSLDTANKALSMLSGGQKIYYVWNLPWIHENPSPILNMGVLGNPNLTVVARSDVHAAAIRNYCGRSDVLVVKDHEPIEKVWRVAYERASMGRDSTTVRG